MRPVLLGPERRPPFFHQIAPMLDPDIGGRLAPPEIEQIHAVFGVDADNDVHRVVAAIRGDGVVRSAIDIERLARRVARVGVKPLGLEIIAGVGRRSLLVKGRPVARELRQRFR